jgi:hypothetical protein
MAQNCKTFDGFQGGKTSDGFRGHNSSSLPQRWRLLWALSRGDSAVDPHASEHRRSLPVVIVISVYVIKHVQR